MYTASSFTVIQFDARGLIKVVQVTDLSLLAVSSHDIVVSGRKETVWLPLDME